MSEDKKCWWNMKRMCDRGHDCFNVFTGSSPFVKDRSLSVSSHVKPWNPSSTICCASKRREAHKVLQPLSSLGLAHFHTKHIRVFYPGKFYYWLNFKSIQHNFYTQCVCLFAHSVHICLYLLVFWRLEVNIAFLSLGTTLLVLS